MGNDSGDANKYSYSNGDFVITGVPRGEIGLSYNLGYFSGSFGINELGASVEGASQEELL